MTERAGTLTSGSLVLRGISAGYVGADVLSDVHLTAAPGRCTVLLGPNGAGKSTLLKCVFGLQPLRSGTIEWDGERIDRLRPAKVALRGVCLVPERRRLFSSEPIADNLLVGGWVRGRAKSELLADREQMYERFPILRERRREPAGSLSGGEAQMLAIAMGLMSRPRVLLLDEPSLGLAPILVEEVMTLVSGLSQEGMTVLLVEQMATKALEVADRAAVLNRGKITAFGSPDELAADPEVKAAYLGD